MELLCDSRHGQYIPKMMARRLHDAGWLCIELSKVEELEAGPDANEWYWDTWNDVLDSACYIDASGVKWFLHHDGDLFAVTLDELEAFDE